MHTLTLDPRAIIVSRKTGLRVYSRQGTVELRSKNLAEVHEILQKQLTGRHTEKTLLSAVPLAQRITVRRYLSALRDAGAFRIEQNNLAQYVTQGRRKVGKNRLLAVVTDRRGQSMQASIQYVTCGEFSSLLVRKSQTRGAARRQVYVLTDGPETVESSPRAAYSRWLLGRQSPSSRKPTIEVFQIDKESGELVRKAMLAGKSLASHREVPKALELVVATDIEQAPLAVCQANSTLCPIEFRRFGLDYDRVADEVLRDVLLCLVMDSAAAARQIRWKRLLIAKDRLAESALPRGIRADNCLVAASWGALRLRILEQWMGQTQEAPAHEERCDLLQPWNFPDLDYLAQVLRQRHTYLQAHVTTRADGLYQCRYGELCTTSLLRHKALRDLMILLSWKTYYERHADALYRRAHECDYSSIANPPQLGRIFSHAIEQTGTQMAEKYFTFAKLSGWGKNAWIGMLDG